MADILASIAGGMASTGGAVLTGGGAGVLAGLAGSLLGRVFGIFEAKAKRKDKELDYAQELKRWGHEKELLNLQMRAKQEETEHAIQLAATSGSYAGLAESIKAEGAIDGAYRWVTSILKLFRPLITVGLWLILAVLIRERYVTGQVLDDTIRDIVFCAVTATTWWFGDRAPRRDARAMAKA